MTDLLLAIALFASSGAADESGEGLWVEGPFGALVFPGDCRMHARGSVIDRAALIRCFAPGNGPYVGEIRFGNIAWCGDELTRLDAGYLFGTYLDPVFIELTDRHQTQYLFYMEDDVGCYLAKSDSLEFVPSFGAPFVEWRCNAPGSSGLPRTGCE
jgi:hypothetical protein